MILDHHELIKFEYFDRRHQFRVHYKAVTSSTFLYPNFTYSPTRHHVEAYNARSKDKSVLDEVGKNDSYVDGLNWGEDVRLMLDWFTTACLQCRTTMVWLLWSMLPTSAESAPTDPHALPLTEDEWCCFHSRQRGMIWPQPTGQIRNLSEISTEIPTVALEDRSIKRLEFTYRVPFGHW